MNADYSWMLKKQVTQVMISEYDSLLDNQSINYKGSLKKMSTFLEANNIKEGVSINSDEPFSATLKHK